MNPAKKKLFWKKLGDLSNRGSLTVQFVFGFALVWGFIALFSVMVFTLAMSSITQYITFASARALFLGTKDFEKQKTAAGEKYDKVKDKFMNGNKLKLFSPDVIEINRKEELGLGLNPAFNASKPNLFYGVWTTFSPKVLTVKTFFGDTEEDNTFFATDIGSYLGREPTIAECKSFDKGRWLEIKRLHGNNKFHPTAAPLPSNKIMVFDNGCRDID